MSEEKEIPEEQEELDEIDRRTFKTLFVQKSKDGEQDAKDLTYTINVFTEDGGILHSVVPIVDEGTTTGYLVVIDDTNTDY
ncbi:MAG: hypothetical protein K0Q73_8596 [Paenibacillus sp.]|jgi:hypothetical protein|nr:hypothetical protein [Paenibacillus sp.]